MIHEGIIDLLKTNATLNALINASVYPSLLPQDATYPCISLHRLTTPGETTLDSKSRFETTFQIDAWGEDYYQAANVRSALKKVLHLYTGTLSEGTKILAAFIENELDFYEEDSYKFRAVSEYTFHYREP